MDSKHAEIEWNEIMKYFGEIVQADEVLKKRVKKFGKDGAHITGINQNHIGKECKIIILKSK